MGLSLLGYVKLTGLFKSLVEIIRFFRGDVELINLFYTKIFTYH
jgi:hypothetical protein